MKSVGRRLNFQLMPLLDLLLIMIFSLYVEARVREEKSTAASADRVASMQATLDEERASLASERQRLELESNELKTHLADVVAQQARSADLIAELFNVPQELIEEALQPLPAGTPPRPPEEVERLRERFRELARLRGSQVVEHLLSYDELRKRADVWTLRILENGQLLLTAGGSTQTFRASTREEFASRLFDRYKTLPQPKGLVVLLVSYGDARADVRQAVLEGLPAAVRLLREDQLGRTQFEYAILGYIDEAAP